jgi:hypothetical protein
MALPPIKPLFYNVRKPWNRKELLHVVIGFSFFIMECIVVKPIHEKELCLDITPLVTVAHNRWILAGLGLSWLGITLNPAIPRKVLLDGYENDKSDLVKARQNWKRD